MQSYKFKYTPLKEIKEIGNVNFYAIIIDASIPYKVDSEDRYECAIKLIDKEENLLYNKKENIFNLIISSTYIKNLPYIHCIGDIIRVVRGSYVNKKERKAILHLENAKNTKANWSIFIGRNNSNINDISPVLCSQEEYHFESQDKDIILSFRKFIQNHFAIPKSINYPLSTKLKKRAKGIETLAQVVNKTELFDRIVYFIQDETDACELHTIKYFNFIDVNDVLRIREYIALEKGVLVINERSNILKIPSYTNYYKCFINRLILKVNEDKIFTMNNHELVIYPIDVNENIVFKSIRQIEDKDNVFILEVSILDFQPNPLRKSINVLCSSCNSIYQLNEIEYNNINSMFYCSFCREIKVGKLHFNLFMHAFDVCDQNEIITLHLCSYDGEGENFFGMSLYDIISKNEKYENLLSKANKLINKNSTVRVIVEKIETNITNNHFIYRIIGRYKANI